MIFTSSFSSGNTLFVQIWSKNQNFQFKLKFGTQTNSNDGEFNGGVQFFCFRLEIPILDKFGSKIRNCLFKVKFGAHTNSDMQNSMVMFTFSFFDQRYFFWANLAQKVKIASLSWNSVPRLIQICRFQRWCSPFPFLTGNTLFGQIWSIKIKSVSLSWNLVLILIQICRIQWWCSLFLFSTESTLIEQICSKKSKLSV